MRHNYLRLRGFHEVRYLLLFSLIPKGKASVAASRPWHMCVGFVLLVWFLLPLPAWAQSPGSRAEVLAAEQEEKSRNLQPYRRNFFERRLLDIEEAGGLAVVRGWFVTFGDIKQGSGVALGPAYGKLFDNGSVLIAKGAYSVRNFKMVQLSAAAPPIARGRVTLGGRVRWQDETRQQNKPHAHAPRTTGGHRSLTFRE